MKSNTRCIAGGRQGGALLVMVLLLSGCADSPPWGGWSMTPSAEQLAAARGRRPETFIYFSRYEVYQNERTKEYVYEGDRGWMHSVRPPTAIAESTLLASPAVKVVLEDEPGQAHAAVRRAHPADWRNPSGVMAAMP
jgi:hypothetical protein